MAADSTAPALMDVVIITYNGIGCIEACLESLRSQPRIGMRLIDNASTDGTVLWVRRHFPEVQVTALADNLGFGRANNIGIADALASGARYVLLLNQDTVVPEGSLERLQAFMETHPDIGACSPLQCQADLARPDPKTLAYYLAPHALPYLSDLMAGTVQPHYEVHGLNAAVWLVRTETFRRAGGFDPLFFMYGEDDDLLHRWRHLGIRFALVPEVRIAHVRYRSPPTSPQPGRIELEARWQHSRLLLQAKKPGYGTLHIARLLVVRGLLEPVLDALVDLEGCRLAGRWLATLRLLWQLPTLARHAWKTSRLGAHFLAENR